MQNGLAETARARIGIISRIVEIVAQILKCNTAGILFPA